MRYILFFLLITFSCIQCKNECIDENIKLGNVSFDESTLEFIDVYTDKDHVSFISDSGEIRVHNIELQESTNPFLCVKVTCRPSYEVDGLNGCEYYDAEERHYILSSDELQIDVKAQMKLFKNETEDYYEFFEVGLTNADTSFVVGNVTATNFEDPTFQNQSVLQEYFTETISGPIGVFGNAHKYISDGATLIYKRNEGLVYYKINNVAWTLME